MPRVRPGSSGRSRSRKLTHSLSCPAQAGHPVFADNVHYGATVSVRSLSSPEIGLARVRHLKWPKSDKSDFGWERVGVSGLQNYRETLTPHPTPLPTGEGADRACCPVRHHDSSHGETALDAQRGCNLVDCD